MILTEPILINKGNLSRIQRDDVFRSVKDFSLYYYDDLSEDLFKKKIEIKKGSILSIESIKMKDGYLRISLSCNGKIYEVSDSCFIYFEKII